MFPGDKNGGGLIRRFFQFVFQRFDFPKTKFGVDRQPATDGRRLNRRQRTDVIVFVAIHFLRGVGREHKLRPAIFGRQHIGQRQRAVEADNSVVPDRRAVFRRAGCRQSFQSAARLVQRKKPNWLHRQLEPGALQRRQRVIDIFSSPARDHDDKCSVKKSIKFPHRCRRPRAVS